MIYKPNFYTLTTITNLHMGSSGETHGVIDNQVQRDPVTGLPILHASGIKGALRELFKEGLGFDKQKVADIFGSDTDEKDADSKSGNHYFFDGHLLALPVRTNVAPYYLSISSALLKQLHETMLNFDKQLSNTLENNIDKAFLTNNQPETPTPTIIKGSSDKVIIEDPDLEATNPSSNIVCNFNQLGDKLIYLSDNQLKELAEDLPVIARNRLENGKSKNLWYTEIVPRKTVFWGCFLVNESKVVDGSTILGGLDTNNNIIQIGGNASVGYGFCKFQLIDDKSFTDEKSN